MAGAVLASIKDADDFARRFDVSRETIDKLLAYEALLRQWQKTINLVAPSTLDEHLVAALRRFSAAPGDRRARCQALARSRLRRRFPGMVLAIMLAGRDGAKVTLVESDTRKAAFLGEVARRTGAAVDIRPERIEKVATQSKLGPADVITARALAPLPRLLELAAPAFTAHTTGLFLKGREAETEVDAAKERWEFASELHPSLTDSSGRIVVIRALQAKTEGPSR